MKSFIVTAILFFGCILSANALKFNSGDNLKIENPVYEDLYIAGGTLTINAPIHGDLVIAGGTIIINDSVTGDLMIAGGDITVNGFIGDDVRCAGGDIKINAGIAGDLLIGAGSVTINSNSAINGDVMAGAGSLKLDGVVRGDMNIGSGDVTINGNIGKDFDCRGEKAVINGIVSGKSIISAHDLTVGPDAAFHNDVRYWSKGKVDFGLTMKNGIATYDPSLAAERAQWYFLGFTAILLAFWYLAVAFLFIILIQYLLRNLMRTAGSNIQAYTGKSLGYGLLFFIAVPVAAVLLCITIIGIPLGILALIVYAMLAVLASVISAVVIANWLSRNKVHKSNGNLAFMALLIFLGLKFISFIPFIGWLAMFVISCIAFGGIILSINRRNKAVV